jgi:hypothetical protein
MEKARLNLTTVNPITAKATRAIVKLDLVKLMAETKDTIKDMVEGKNEIMVKVEALARRRAGSVIVMTMIEEEQLKREEDLEKRKKK